jgi:CHAD domain-containing protein
MTYRIGPDRPFAAEIRRIGAELVDGALADLERARRKPEEGFHRCRRRIKRLRALIRLVRAADPEYWKAEDARWRDLSRSVAGAREAAALVETLDRVVADFPRETRSSEFVVLRAALVARHDRIAGETSGIDSVIGAAIWTAEGGRAALATATLPEDPGEAADLLAEGAGRVVRRAIGALRKARKSGDTEDFHELRKCVKAHAMHVELLRAYWPRPVKARLKALDALGERLGELNDALVMRQLAASDHSVFGADETRRVLMKLLKRTEKKLRGRCLDEAEAAFDPVPRKIGRTVAGRYRDEAKAG